MGRRLRFIPPDGSLVEITNRTIQGRHLLRPSVDLNRLLVGVLGRAQRLFGVRLHALVVLSNHYHLLLTVESATQLAGFVGYFQGNLAKEAGRLHRWRGPFWHRRYQHVLVSDEEAAQVARLRYILTNSCKEDLVSNPLEWPGVSSLRALLFGERLEGTWIDRTQEHRSPTASRLQDLSRFSEKEQVEFEPLPCWSDLQPTIMRKWISNLVSEIETETLERHRVQGSRPLGRQGVLRQDPHSKPKRSKWSPAPLVHCVSSEVRTLIHEAYSSFVQAFREAAEILTAKGLLDKFPEGAFPPPIPCLAQARAPG
jgi:REP element-mobilizing transposase RayT